MDLSLTIIYTNKYNLTITFINRKFENHHLKHKNN